MKERSFPQSLLDGVLVRQKSLDIKKELFRKSIHLCSGFIPFLLGLAYWWILGALGFVLVLYIISEILRLKGIEIPLISAITSAAARKRDENKFVLGPVTLCLGIISCALLYDPLPAAIGIYALSFGDGLASLFGKLFGHAKIPFTQGKTAAGSLTCFAAIFISCFAASSDCTLALMIASCGMIIEVLPLKDFDNILIPLILGGFSQLLIFLGF